MALGRFLWSLWTKNSPCLTYQLSVPKELLQSGVGLDSWDQSKLPRDYQAETHWQHWCQNKQHFYDVSWHKWIWNWMILFRKCKHKFAFHAISHHPNEKGPWHPSSRKTRTYVSSVASIMGANYLAAQKSRRTAPMILTKPNNFLMLRLVVFYK